MILRNSNLKCGSTSPIKQKKGKNIIENGSADRRGPFGRVRRIRRNIPDARPLLDSHHDSAQAILSRPHLVGGGVFDRLVRSSEHGSRRDDPSHQHTGRWWPRVLGSRRPLEQRLGAGRVLHPEQQHAGSILRDLESKHNHCPVRGCRISQYGVPYLLYVPPVRYHLDICAGRVRVRHL